MPLPSDAIALDNQQGKLPPDAVALDNPTPKNDSIMNNMKSGQNPLQATGNYIKEHPFKTNFQSAVQTVTGKSAEQMADEAVQNNKDLGQSNERPFDNNLGIVAPTALATNIGGQAVDAVTTPFNYEAGPLIGKAASLAKATPEALRGAAGRIGNFLVKVPDKAFSYGKDPMQVMADEKISGNSITDYATNAKDRLNQRNNELQSALAGSDKKIDAGSIIDKHTDTAYDKLKGSTLDRSSDVNNLNNISTQFSKDYGDLNNLSVQNALKMKQTLADDYPFTHENSNDVVANYAHKMYHDISDAIETAEPSVAPLNQKVSSLIDISKAAQKRVSIESRSNPIGLIGTILGATAAGGHFGGATGAVEGAAAGIGTALMAKAASSPAVLTRVANTLSTMADADKIHLFESSPDFMALAKKAFQFKENGNLSMAGKVGSSEVTPDIPQVTKRDLTTPAIATAATGLGSTIGSDKANAQGNDYDFISQFEGGKQIKNGKLISNGGIQQPTLDQYNKENNQDLELNDMNKNQIKSVRDWYLNKQGYDDLGDKTKKVMADYAYHFGPTRANKDLQRIVGASRDGKIGPETISKSNDMDDSILANKILDEQNSYMKLRSNYSRYANGWNNRLNKVKNIINGGGK